MPAPQTMPGGSIRLFVNNKVYSVSQSVILDHDPGENPTYGINSPYPQDIGIGQIMTRGSVRGLRIRQSGGIQGSNALALFSDRAAANYVSLRLEDRSTGETIWSIPKAKLSKISESVAIKGTYKINFDFVGQILYYTLDLS